MNIPEKAKWDLKMIIEAEHDQEKLLQECLLLYDVIWSIIVREI